MSWSEWIRQFHRWMAITFTLAVVVNIIFNFVIVGQQQIATVVGLLTLIPLFLLMFTGLYMFVLPYVSKRRDGAE